MDNLWAEVVSGAITLVVGGIVGGIVTAFIPPLRSGIRKIFSWFQMCLSMLTSKSAKELASRGYGVWRTTPFETCQTTLKKAHSSLRSQAVKHTRELESLKHTIRLIMEDEYAYYLYRRNYSELITEHRGDEGALRLWAEYMRKHEESLSIVGRVIDVLMLHSKISIGKPGSSHRKHLILLTLSQSGALLQEVGNPEESLVELDKLRMVVKDKDRLALIRETKSYYERLLSD